MKEEMRGALPPPELEADDDFVIAGFRFQIFKSNDFGKSEAPYTILVRDQDKDEWWMDKGKHRKSLALCYYNILLFLTQHT